MAAAGGLGPPRLWGSAEGSGASRARLPVTFAKPSETVKKKEEEGKKDVSVVFGRSASFPAHWEGHPTPGAGVWGVPVAFRALEEAGPEPGAAAPGVAWQTLMKRRAPPLKAAWPVRQPGGGVHCATPLLVVRCCQECFIL